MSLTHLQSSYLYPVDADQRGSVQPSSDQSQRSVCPGDEQTEDSREPLFLRGKTSDDLIKNSRLSRIRPDEY